MTDKCKKCRYKGWTNIGDICEYSLVTGKLRLQSCEECTHFEKAGKRKTPQEKLKEKMWKGSQKKT